jgi:hypothetical protein
MKHFSLLFLIVLVQLVASCTPNQRIVNSSTEQWSNTNASGGPTPVKNPFEQDLESMRTADFIFIYILRRKDGAPLDADDKRFASLVIPGEMNRRSVSDEGKAIIIGSNFKMPEDTYKVIAERFALEDLSRPDPATKNTNIAEQPKR